jgi:hypothetical protein
VPEKSRQRIPETCFPVSNIADLGMDKCIRIRPEDNNSGGFFIAVFEKVASYGTLDSKKTRDIVDVSKWALPVEAVVAEPVVTVEAVVTEPVVPVEAAVAEPIACADVETSNVRKADVLEEGNDDKEPTEPALKKVKGMGVKGKGGMGKRTEADFFYLEEKSELITQLADYYGIPKEFNLDQVISCGLISVCGA